MPKNLIDLAGQRFGRLTVKDRAPSDRNGNARWNCVCDCGNTTVSLTWSLRKGESGSCGCLNNDIAAARLTTHGMTGSFEYWPWAMMIQRCTNPKYTKYANYGGRGISVCDAWRSFEQFYKDVGSRPSKAHTLDRIDNDGNYEPGNVRWATKSEQNSNKRNQHWVVYRGKKMALTEAVRLAGTKVDTRTVFSRIQRGWPIDKAIETDAGADRHFTTGPKGRQLHKK